MPAGVAALQGGGPAHAVTATVDSLARAINLRC